MTGNVELRAKMQKMLDLQKKENNLRTDAQKAQDRANAYDRELKNLYGAEGKDDQVYSLESKIAAEENTVESKSDEADKCYAEYKDLEKEYEELKKEVDEEAKSSHTHEA